MAEHSILQSPPSLDGLNGSSSRYSSQRSLAIEKKATPRKLSDSVHFAHEPGSSSSSIQTSSRCTLRGSIYPFPELESAIPPSAISSTPKLCPNKARAFLYDKKELNKRIRRLMRSYYLANYQIHAVALLDELPYADNSRQVKKSRTRKVLNRLKRLRPNSSEDSLNTAEDEAFWVTVHELLVTEEATAVYPSHQHDCDAFCLPGPTSWAIRSACTYHCAFWYDHVRFAIKKCAENAILAVAQQLTVSATISELVQQERWSDLALQVQIDLHEFHKYFSRCPQGDGKVVEETMHAIWDQVLMNRVISDEEGSSMIVTEQNSCPAPSYMAICLEHAFLQSKRAKVALNNPYMSNLIQAG